MSAFQRVHTSWLVSLVIDLFRLFSGVLYIDQQE